MTMTWWKYAASVGALAFAFGYHGPGAYLFQALAVLLAIGLASPGAPRSDFAPISVRIFPTRAFLTETGLATSDEVGELERQLAATEKYAAFAWSFIRTYGRPRHPSEHSLLRDGIWFTIL